MVSVMGTPGRPRGLNINPAAIEDLLLKACISKQELCEAADITPGHLADMLRRDKGAAPATVRAMALALGVRPETIAPALFPQFVYVRPQDVAEATNL